MKSTFAPFAAAIATFSGVISAADDAGQCCAKLKPQPAPSCCCCAKMEKPAASPSLDQLISKAKDAEGDQLLESLAAVLNKLIEERKAGHSGPADNTAPSAHQH